MTREEYLKKRRDDMLLEQEQQGRGPETEEERAAREAVFQLIEPAVGSYCELKTMNNRLIVLGRLEKAEDLIISVVAADETPMPPVIFNTEVKVVIRLRGQPPLVLRGNVCGSSTELWKVDRLDRFHYKESRSYFRQPVSAEANVYTVSEPTRDDMPFDELPEELPACTVLDVSLEGVRFRSAQHFERGDWVSVSNLRLTEEDKFPFTLTGQICWADRASRNEFMFGCRLSAMTEPEQDALCASIFTLQRQELQARRAGRRRP